MIGDLTAEVLVVGAGPAGGMAALELAGRGVRVLLVDRSPFPREKVCGDGLLEESLEALNRAGVETVVRQRAHHLKYIRLYAPNGAQCELEGSFYTLRRRDLDGLVVEEACRRGAQFYDAFQVTGPMVQEERAAGAVGFDRQGREVRIAAKLVLLATGASTRLLRAFGVLESKAPYGVGIRGYFLSKEMVDEDAMIISYPRQLLPGYCWIFPLGGGVFNVGSGLFLENRRNGPRIGQNLLNLIRHVHPLSGFLRRCEPIAPMRAAPIRTGFRGSQACASGTLVLGEALGLTFPFLGEGVSNAFESGRLAARVAEEALAAGDFSTGFLRRYGQDLRRLLERRHKSYLRAQRWFCCAPLANLVIARAGRRKKLNNLAKEVIHGREDASVLFSPLGIFRLLLF